MNQLIYVLLSTVGLSSAVWAQASAPIDPGAVQQHSSETNQYYQLQKRIDQGAKSSDIDGLTNRIAPPPSPSGNSPSASAFLLKTIQTNPSVILTQDEIAAITRKYKGKQVTVQDLNTIVSDFNAFYKSRGYLTATAVLPPQKVVDGLVTIRLVEARLGKVVIKDNRHTRASFITDRMPIESGDLLQLQKVEQSLTRFNAMNDVKVRALLQPGEEFGTTDLVLDVQPSAALTTSFSLDDTGLTSTGRERLGTTETIKSLFGYRDPLSFGAYWSNGMLAGFASYNVPLTVRGLRFGPEVSYNNIRVRQSQLQKLGVNGTFYDLSLRLSRPFTLSDNFTGTAYVAPHFQQSTLQSQNYKIANTPVRSLEVGTSVQAIDARGFWAGNLFASGGDYNLLGLNAFVKFGGTATRVQNLGKGFTAIFRSQGQGKAADPHSLPPSQQFQIGGLSSVRGYPEAAFINDDGYTTSTELDAPFPFSAKKLFGVPLGQRLKTAWFVDHGGVLSGSHLSYLTGTGGGLIVSLSRYLEGRVYLATPLENRSQYKSLAVHFAISANPSFPEMFKAMRRNHE